MKRETIPYLIGVAVILAVWFLAVASAMAHEWMPQHMRYCCNDKDCLPYAREAIERTAGGWRIKATGQVFPDGSPNVHPNVRPDLSPVWICRPEWARDALCLMVSPEGS